MKATIQTAKTSFAKKAAGSNAHNIQNWIYYIRGQRIMVDFDLIGLYKVDIDWLHQIVKSNIEQFPEKFTFQLTLGECQAVWSQTVTVSKNNVSKLQSADLQNRRLFENRSPYAFTWQSVATLGRLLASEEAIKTTILILEAFTEEVDTGVSTQLMHNPYTNKLEETKIYEYSFEDWKDGKPVPTYPRGFIKVRNNDTKQDHWEYHDNPIELSSKIAKEQERIYWIMVDKSFKNLTTGFKHQYAQSLNKEYLKSREIEGFKKLFLAEELSLNGLSYISQPLKEYDFYFSNYTPSAIQDIRNHYQSIIRSQRSFKSITWDQKEVSSPPLEAFAKYYNWLLDDKNFIEPETKIESSDAAKNPLISIQEGITSNDSKHNSSTKTFAEYLLHKNNTQLARGIHKSFSKEKSRVLRILLEVLQSYNNPLLTIELGQKKKLYKAMQAYFGKNIGSYQSIFDYNYFFDKDESDFTVIKARVDFILRTI